MRLVHRFIVLLCVTLLAPSASAQYTRDKAGNAKIDEAINQHYLVTDFDKAEGVLLGTINACGDKCSPATIARAWMYVGIVRGSGKGDQAGAKEAFSSALAVDPNVKLDEALATPDTKASFESAGGAGVVSAPPAVAATPDDDEPAVAGSMTCTPQVSTVQTRMPIPVSCVSDEDATQMELRYKEFGGTDWKTLKMRKAGDDFRVEIPCAATELAGTLQFYVRAKDAAGDNVDNYGTKRSPIQIQLQNEPTDSPPAFPGEAPPARCEGEVICPPDFPGCKDETSTAGARGGKDWGAGCNNSVECKSGLLCLDGSCQTAPSCTIDEDCPAGVCIAGTCDIPADEAEATAGGPYKKNWVGVHVAQDFAFIQGTNVCTIDSQLTNSFACYVDNPDTQARDAPYPPIASSPDPITNGEQPGDPYPGTGIALGSIVATTRVMLSYDRAFIRNLSGGVRLGYAFRGGPPSVTGTKFLPIHAEARFTYWFVRPPFSDGFFKPYAHMGGGLAQVDAKKELLGIYDCSTIDDTTRFFRCINGDEGYDPTADNQVRQVDVDAWKKAGQGFVTAGLGTILSFGSVGVQINVNGMYMLPSSAPVIQPSLGMVLGF